ncbi:MAG: glycosyltransferase family 2 protein [Gordonia sp. (in: high G+C Gram-positive bacteria)]
MAISLVIPCFNEEGMISACLDSVVAQTRQFDEVIVVDNNSRDRTVQIASSYSDRLPIRLLRESRQGVAFASQAGYDAAAGDVIARIDADTRLDPRWAARAVAYFDENADVDGLAGAGWLYGMSRCSGKVKALASAERFPDTAVADTWFMNGNNCAIRRSAWLKVRGTVKNLPGTHEDIDVSCALGDAGCTMRVLPGMLAALSPRRFAGRFRDNVKYGAAVVRTLVAYRRWKLTALYVVGLPINLATVAVWGVYARRGQGKGLRPSPVTR